MYWIEMRSWVYLFVGAVIAIGLGLFFFKGFVSVPEGQAMILIRKTGKPLAPGQIITDDPSQQGIQLQLYPEGWHFLNPYIWEAVIVPKLEIQEGKLGVKIRLYGEKLPLGQVIAENGQKGILADILRPGRHTLNPYAYRVEIHPKVEINPGHVGVVVRLSGKDPENPNVFITKQGERGTQNQTLEPGHYYVNPYIQNIIPVDVRAHKFDLENEHRINFPSKDGFNISMDGTIEWSIDRERVAEVFAKYVDDRSAVIQNIIEKIILPYARAFSRIEGSKYLAREFIGGDTRQKFQEDFFHGMKKTCDSQGIKIKAALIKNVIPPKGIIDPIKQKEIAIRQREKYLKQMEREKQQKQFAIEKNLQSRAQLQKQAEADVSVNYTNAEREQQVALINAQKQLEYARLRLQAANNQAQIILSRGQAKSQVIRLKNKANAEGLRHSVSAFGSGDVFVRYLYYQKIAPSIQYILSNTDGPFLRIFEELGAKLPASPSPQITQKVDAGSVGSSTSKLTPPHESKSQPAKSDAVGESQKRGEQ
jgi:regulator of protease activity HflC (stomatin/prohibitin superfamily)